MMLYRLALAVGLFVSSLAACATGGAAAPASSARGPVKSTRAERLVLAQPDVKAWSAAVFAAGRSVAFRSDRVAGQPHCVDETVYEDAGAYLTRYGTWRVCGAAVRRLRDD